MTKTTIKKWIDSQCERAVWLAMKQGEERAEKKIDAIWAKNSLQKVADNIQEHINFIIPIAEACDLTVAKALDRPELGCWEQMSYMLTKSLTGQSVEKTMRELYFRALRTVERNKTAQHVDKIRSEYTVLQENVKSFKDAKAALVYLEELGFDLTTLHALEAQPTTALAKQIDTSLLLIGKSAA
jgi:hypothetical protein